MKTKLIFTINGIIHIIMGSFLWIGANIIGKPFTNNSFQLKAPGENLTDGIHMVIASTVDTVGAFNIGIGLMLLIIRNINDLESAKKLLMGHFSLIISVLILSGTPTKPNSGLSTCSCCHSSPFGFLIVRFPFSQ